MTTTLSTLAALLAVLIIPVLFVAWLIESRPERIQRLHRAGWSQRRIADHLGATCYRVRLALA